MDALDVALCGLGSEGKCPVKPDGHFRGASARQVPAESGWNLNYQAQLSAAQAFLEVCIIKDGRARGEIARTREVLEIRPTLRGLIAIQGCVGQALDIECNAEPEHHHQHDRT